MTNFAGARNNSMTYQRINVAMCLKCVNGRHECETEGCPCCCNDLDFPWPAGRLEAAAQRAIAEQDERMHQLGNPKLGF